MMENPIRLLMSIYFTLLLTAFVWILTRKRQGAVAEE